MVKYAKPRAFYDVFERKGPGQVVSHYCPGCGHGVAHKLIASVIDELGIQDKTVFCSPVGCSVFGYYYFDTGNVQCAHGRAPAVATGLRRSLSDAIVISYQGDGDLAGIGLAEIVHAANRGENITVFFINNAIYGMTGGQMAPTTPVGIETPTCPYGRARTSDGDPVHMSEMIATLTAPVYVERVSLASPAKIVKARRAVKKALTCQLERRGFSFVEILSPCPINWKMTPVEARQWMVDVLEPIFPLGVYVDSTGEKQHDRSIDDAETGDAPRFEPVFADADAYTAALASFDLPPIEPSAPLDHECRVKIAGFGGQGVMSAGVLIANCASAEGRRTSWLPSYGPEMRGGTANASVIVSDDTIGAPVVDEPTVLIAMNRPSIDTFASTVAPGGVLIYNSSIVSDDVSRDDCTVVAVPASDIAREKGFIQGANVVMVAVFAMLTRTISVETVKKILPASLKRSEFVEINLELIDAAAEFLETAVIATANGGPRS